MTQTAQVRDYDLVYHDDSSPKYVTCTVISTAQSKYDSMPDLDEIFDTFNITTPVDVRFNTCFANASGCKAFPRIPDGSSLCDDMFYLCGGLIIPPAMPDNTPSFYSTFYSCSDMVHAPVIPQDATDIRGMFEDCSALLWPVSIPPGVTRISDLFNGCSSIQGEAVIRPTSFLNKSYVFRDTVQPITLYGDQAICETLAATGNNGNVTWSPWYDPVPAVTNRGEGSRTTASDLTRMVRNGALAVSSYAPGRMVYQTGDIVREDEWNALVEAAQTIDPTVTYSTHYTNLNKIEAAFDSAL